MSTVGRTAIEIAEMVRTGQVRATEVVADHLRQIQMLEPSIHAMLAQRPEKALAEAAELEHREDLASLPLAGVPVTIKDSVDVAGEPTRMGSLAMPDTPREADDELVRRLRQAGCIVVGKTNQPELAIWHFTESNLGTTRNPWNPDRSPGGSTGGGAAGVAAAMTPVAQGSDGGGSIRLPSAFCGLFGIKPGPDVVPVAGGAQEHWFGLSQWGPLATTVADAALMLDVLAGTKKYRDVQPPAGRLRLALSVNPPAAGVRVNREVRLAVEAAADALREAGHTVTVVNPPYSPAYVLHFVHRWLAGIALEADELGLDLAKLEPRTQRMVRIGRYLNRYRPVPRDGMGKIYERFEAWFEDFDVLLTPTTAQPSVPASGWLGKSYVATMLKGTNQVPFTPGANMLNLPAASIPVGLTADGFPIGMQMISPRGGEALILSLARQLEELRPWPRHAPMAGIEGEHPAPVDGDAGVRRWFAGSRP
ncbi:MAG TPA: amidase family protein [Candidatus Solibacter sp.]|jgi:amidase|nr:amidase family protein [Candidatus Solibacter sp.]